MKQTCKQNRLPIVTVVLGCCALVLRRVLYAVAVDVKNLLPVNHPLEIVLWVLTAIAAAWIIASGSWTARRNMRIISSPP